MDYASQTINSQASNLFPFQQLSSKSVDRQTAQIYQNAVFAKKTSSVMTPEANSAQMHKIYN